MGGVERKRKIEKIERAMKEYRKIGHEAFLKKYDLQHADAKTIFIAYPMAPILHAAGLRQGDTRTQAKDLKELDFPIKHLE